MKIITIQETKDGTGFVASVNSFQNATVIAEDEVTALRGLLEKIEAKNKKFIQKMDWS